jgi:nicotinate-nucleotide adenylyltransferase
VLLRFRPDSTSATRLRLADPAWQRRFLRRSNDIDPPSSAP